MWLYTDLGFISIVKFDPKHDSVKRSNRERKSWGKNPRLVRARVRDDLEQIRPFYSKLKIDTDGSADYKYRAIVPAQRLAEFAAAKMMDIDYDSHVKEVVRDRAPKAEGRYEAMTKAWTAFASMQDTAPYAGAKWWEDYYASGTSKYSGYNYSFGTDYKGLCPQYLEYDADGNSYRSWCTRMKDHPGECSMDDVVKLTKTDIKLSTPKSATATQFSSATEDNNLLSLGVRTSSTYEPSNPFNMADSVEDMCKELLVSAPDDIKVDEATPYFTYDLWARALEEFREPLTSDEVMEILEELAQDYLTVDEARNKYEAALHKFVSQSFAAETLEDNNEILPSVEFAAEEELTSV